jgi:hypothetical protein
MPDDLAPRRLARTNAALQAELERVRERELWAYVRACSVLSHQEPLRLAVRAMYAILTRPHPDDRVYQADHWWCLRGAGLLRPGTQEWSDLGLCALGVHGSDDAMLARLRRAGLVRERAVSEELRALLGIEEGGRV